MRCLCKNSLDGEQRFNTDLLASEYAYAEPETHLIYAFWTSDMH